MQPVSVLFGVALALLAGWLHLREKSGWMGEDDSQLDRVYLQGRRRGRRVVNLTILGIGILIAAAGMIGGGIVFVFAWGLVLLGLLLIVLLAVIDIFRTQNYLNRKLPEIRKRAFQASDSRLPDSESASDTPGKEGE